MQAPNKPAGYHSDSGTCRAKTISYLDISSHFFHPGHLVPLFGSPRPILYNGFYFFNAILLCVKIYFLNRLLYIGKFYHISCNTVLFRLFNSVCIYVYTRINIIIIILL